MLWRKPKRIITNHRRRMEHHLTPKIASARCKQHLSTKELTERTWNNQIRKHNRKLEVLAH
jgi:hypothetical protein